MGREVITDLSDPPSPGEERRLLDAIAADPESDAPRLAYADWVETRDPRRAEFIRIGVEVARRAPRPDPSDPISVRYLELQSWFSRPVSDGGLGSRNVDRGFVSFTTLDSDLPLVDAAARFESNPGLRGVAIFVRPGSAESLASLPYLSRLTDLKICRYSRSGPVDDGRLAELIASPHLTALKELAFEDAGVGPETARAIGGCAASAALERLSISGDGAFDCRAAAALAAGRLGTLWRLNISECALRAEGCAALAASPVLCGVRWLGLAGNRIDDEGARALAGSPLGACTTLKLRRTSIGDEGAVALAGSPAFEALEELDLSGNYVGDAGAAAFAVTPYFPRLVRLLLQENSIGEEGAEALAGSDRLPSLEVLGLAPNAIYTGEYTEVVDYYDGGPVGGHPIRADVSELERRYGRRFKIE
jgi:uncharacterized protein (TIGR02996 family)